MAKLEALLEQRGVASPREVSEAVARSQLHGGDVTTSLLQFSNIDEAALSAALSECYGLPAANVGALPTPSDAAAAPIPREVAERYCCFALESGPGELVLAVAKPLAALLKEELGFAFGARLSERVALEVRIRQAISRCYGGSLSERDQRAIERLDGVVDAAGNGPAFGAWPDTQLSALPRPPSEPLPAVEERADWPREDWGNVAGAAPRPAPAQNSGPRSRRRGPFTLAMAREELARATSRNQVLDAFFSFACQFFEYSALFAVHNALAEGLNAAGPGAGSEEIQAVGVPLDLPSSLSEAAESCNVRITRLGRDGIDRTLAVDLRRQLTTRVLILPVCLRGRCAVLLYGDNGPSDVVEGEVADVVALAPDVAAAIGRIILQRKRDAARQGPLDSAEWSYSLVPPRTAPAVAAGSASTGRASTPPDAADSAATDFSIPTLPSKNRDRSRSNGRGGARGSVPPASPTEANAQPVAPHVLVPIEPAAGETLAEPPRAPAPAASANGEDPVFLLARGNSRESPVPPAPVAPRKEVLHTAITRPARTVLHQPRLPSVIVDESATEETPWTRAGAATQPPQNVTNALSARSAAAVPNPVDAATLRPASRRQPAAPQRVEILPPAVPPGPAETALTDPAPAQPAFRDDALTDPAPAHPALADPPAEAPPPPPAAAVPPPAAAPPPAPAAAPLAAAAASPSAAASASPSASPSAAASSPPAPHPPRHSATRVSFPPPPPDATAPSPAVSLASEASQPSSDETSASAAPSGAPIKPFEQRPITGSPRRNSAPPLPPFSKDRPSSPPAAPGALSPFSKDRPSSPPAAPGALSPFSKDRPSSPPGAPGVTSRGAAGSAPPPGRQIAIARPDSPSVRAVPRTPTARPPDPFMRPAAATASQRPLGGSTSSAEALQPSGTEAKLASPIETGSPAATPATAAPTGSAPRPSQSPEPAPPPGSVRPAPASQRPLRDALPPTSSTPAEPEIEALIEQLVQGNPRAVQDLTRIGAATVPQLMAHFPGPVVSERAGPSSRASECGPLLQTLASIGSPALPNITRSTEDHDARVRRWATLLLGEMPGPEACRAVVQRLADDVPRVHQAALDAARLLLSSSAANLFRKTLFEVAEAEDAPLTLRLRTLEHVARLRDSASVPRLIAFLALDTEPVVHKALWALTVITRQDFGRDAQSWGDWWQAHQSKHRFQWLIEALDHRDPRLRKAAADELLIEAKDSFGYTENLPEPERLEAQRRYQEWWENTGARRFGRLQ